MKWRKIALAAVLLTVPVFVLSQTVQQDGSRLDPGRRGSGQAVLIGGMISADTTMGILRTDDNGNLKVVENSPLISNYRTGTLINNQLGASGTAMGDSNAVPVQTYDLKRIGLSFYGIFDSLSTVVRVAVQVRAHFTQFSDSIATMPWHRWTNAGGIPGGTGDGVIRADSIGNVSLVAESQVPLTPVQATSANSAGGGLLPGEFEVIFNYSRDDTTAAGNGKPFSAPRGIYVPLTGAMGEWFCAPYMSVRVRVINGVRSRFRIRVDYAGTSL